LFDEGDKLMSDGRLAQACDAFDASNKVESRAGTLLRLGECREQNHELASAWSAYKDALTLAKDPAKRDFARAKVAELEPKLSYLMIAVAELNKRPGLAITRNAKPVDPALWNHAVPVDGGEAVIVARADGYDEWKTTVTVPRERGKITVDVPELSEPAKPTLAEPAQRRAPPVAPVVMRVEAKPRPVFTTRRKLALAVAGVAVTSVAVGSILGISAKTREDDAFALCPNPAVACANAPSADQFIRSGHSLAIGADVLFGVAGVAAIGAGALWFTGAPESRHPVTIVPAPSGISVAGSF
jgi:hypothetical protein